MKLSVNDLVRVTLTEVGVRVWAAYEQSRGLMSFTGPMPGDTHEMELQEAFAIFGEAMKLTGPPPIEPTMELLQTGAAQR